jgi:hypothetical protein
MCNNSKTSDHQENETPNSLNVLDSLVLISLDEDSRFQPMIENLMDDLLRRDSFPFSSMDTYLDLVVKRNRNVQESLLPSLLEMIVFLLLSPVHINY